MGLFPSRSSFILPTVLFCFLYELLPHSLTFLKLLTSVLKRAISLYVDFNNLITSLFATKADFELVSLGSLLLHN